MGNLPVVQLPSLSVKGEDVRLMIIKDVPFYGEPRIILRVFCRETDYSHHEPKVYGDVLLERMRSQNNSPAGLSHLRRLLKNKDIIPEEWKDIPQIIFPGTIAVNEDGERFVPVMNWSADDEAKMEWIYVPPGYTNVLCAQDRVALIETS